MTRKAPALDVILKVASRCNLNCSYCYVYNKGDMSWRDRPTRMSDQVIDAAITRIRRHCLLSQQPRIDIAFHGGEPSLIGADQFSEICGRLRDGLDDLVAVKLLMQTNGTLLDESWISVLEHHDVHVGISVDGPKDVHDAFRVDHQGRGSYDAVTRGVELLRSSRVHISALTVVQLGQDGLRSHRHLRALGFDRIHYLLPDFTHDTIDPVRQEYGPTPCADYLLPILEHWWMNEAADVSIGIFWHMARLIYGGASQIDFFGSPPLRFIFIESDGALEGLDVLKICEPGMSGTGLNVLTSEFMDVADRSDFYRNVMFDGIDRPAACRGCREERTCGGGYLPHRYSRAAGFDNRSVWCRDILLMFDRFRDYLNVPVQQTLVLQDERGVSL